MDFDPDDALATDTEILKGIVNNAVRDAVAPLHAKIKRLETLVKAVPNSVRQLQVRGSTSSVSSGSWLKYEVVADLPLLTMTLILNHQRILDTEYSITFKILIALSINLRHHWFETGCRDDEMNMRWPERMAPMSV